MVMYDSTDFTYLPIDGLDPMIAYEKPLVKKVTNNRGNCEEDLPKKPVGRLLVNCRPTGFFGELFFTITAVIGRSNPLIF